MNRRVARVLGWSVGAAVVAASLGLMAYNVWMTLPGGRADPNDSRQVAQGQSVYERMCASCHGRSLEGQPNWRQALPTGGFPAPPHDESGHTWHHPDSVLFNITKSGGQSAAPQGFKSNMPGFGGLLRDEEIWAVLAYIKSRWPSHIQARQEEVTRRNRSG
jgi:mono/diheme cytochrome c family protein